jgi:hypothetical protein
VEAAQIQRYVREHPFFAGMSSDHCAVASRYTRLVCIPENGYLFRQSEPAIEFYLVRQGRIGLQWPGLGVTLLTVGEDEFLGTACEVPPRRWTCDAIAFACVSALAVDAARLKDAWENDHAFGVACLRRMLSSFQSHLDHARLQALDLYG